MIAAGFRGSASILATLGAIGVTAVMAVAVGSPPANMIAALFPPWWSAARIFQAAAGTGDIVGVGRVPSMIVVRSDRAALAARLRAAGALATFDANELGGCRSSNAETQQ